MPRVLVDDVVNKGTRKNPWIYFPEVANAQCVMCKAVGEQSSKLDGLGRGLNAGILFLMAIPYVLLSLGAFIIWRRFNKQGE